MLSADEWKLKEGYLGIGAQNGAKATGSKGRGITYENKAVEKLTPAIREHLPEFNKILNGPWYRNVRTRKWRQPDLVLINEEDNVGIVVEIKLNWKPNICEKLIDTYLPLVKRAHSLDIVWPLLVTRCFRNCPNPKIVHARDMQRAMAWQPGDMTPVMMVLA